jgi:predicted metal-dependent hydrolase
LHPAPVRYARDMAELGKSTITIRRLDLAFPVDIDPVLIEGQPELSYTQIGLSLLLPYLEPYLIRSMHAAKPHVRDPRLLADIDLFNGQEAQHYQQHRRFNELVRVGIRDGGALQELEAEIDADYRRFSERRSLRFNLAYAEGFEAVTSAMAHFCFETALLDQIQKPAVRELFRWHLAEELEHRTVTFDVYRHVFGGYFYRLCVGIFAHWHLDRFVRRVARVLVESDAEAFRARYGGQSAWSRLKPWLWLALTRLWPKILKTYMPWYSPHRIAMPANARALAQYYSELAAQTPSRAERS